MKEMASRAADSRNKQTTASCRIMGTTLVGAGFPALLLRPKPADGLRDLRRGSESPDVDEAFLALTDPLDIVPV